MATTLHLCCLITWSKEQQAGELIDTYKWLSCMTWTCETFPDALIGVPSQLSHSAGKRASPVFIYRHASDVTYVICL